MNMDDGHHARLAPSQASTRSDPVGMRAWAASCRTTSTAADRALGDGLPRSLDHHRAAPRAHRESERQP